MTPGTRTIRSEKTWRRRRRKEEERKKRNEGCGLIVINSNKREGGFVSE